MKRALVALLTLALPACGSIGLDQVRPLEEATHAPPPELVAEVHALPPTADAEVIVDGRLWVPWGAPTEMDAAELRSVGSAHGMTVYARAWDRSPLDELFARHDGEWQRYAPVIGRSGGVPTH